MLNKWKVPLALAVLAWLAVLALRRGPRRHVRAGWPVNLGHRGASARYPENTLAAFLAAVEAGAGGLELDVHLTRDGHPVVIHDATVDRTTDGFGAVAGMTLDDLRRLDAGRGGGSGEKMPVPTLRELLAEFPDVLVNIEIKETKFPGAEKVVLDVLREAGAAGRVLVASAHHRVLRRFRKVSGGEYDTGASRFEIGVFYWLSLLRLERLLRPAYVALQVPPRHGAVRILTPRFVGAAHSLGVRVDVWTINEADQMGEVLDLGVDAIMTDFPERLAEVLGYRQTQG